MSQNASRNNEENIDLTDYLVSIRRVAKVVKGGRRFGFSALVIVGDNKGKVGFGTGKALEVGDSRTKALQDAKKSMVKVPLKEGRTIHHDIIGRFGSAKVILRSAPPGTGIIAGGPLRAVFESLGIHDVVVKSQGTNNPHNMVKACFNAFENMNSPKSIADKRGLKISDIVARRDVHVASDVSSDDKAASNVEAKEPTKKKVSSAKKEEK